MSDKEEIECINLYKLYNSKLEKVFNKLLPYMEDNKFNIFETLKITQTEIRHSNVLSYLLDVKGNHNLDSQFLKLFLSLLQEYNYNDGKNILNNIDSYKVSREMEHRDITLVNDKEKVIIVIENKINSEDYKETEYSNGQLKKYREKVEEKYIDYKHILLYLTPLGDEPNAKEELAYWHLLSYRDIYNILSKLFFDEKVSVKVKNFIEDYREIVKRYVMETDKELEDICTKIYNDNRCLFDLVIKNKRDFALDTIKNFCEQNKEEINVFTSPRKNYIYFTTPDIDEIVNKNNFTKNSIFYEIEIRNADISIYFNFEENSEKIIEEYFEKKGLKMNNKYKNYTRIGAIYTRIGTFYRKDETSEDYIISFLKDKLSPYINFKKI